MLSRRQWLGRSLAAAPVLGPALPAFSAEKSCGMAMGTYGLPGMPLADAIDLVAETGFNAIEITVFPETTGDPAIHFDTAEKIAAVRDRIADKGLRLCALMAHLRPEEEDAKHREQLAKLRSLVELARALAPDDPPLLQTVLGGKGWESSKVHFRDRIADWNQVLANQRGRISIKPHRGNAMSTPANAVWLLEQLGNPRRIRMVYDFSHYAFRDPELTIEETVATALPVTNYVAAKDAKLVDGKVRFDLVGESKNWDHADIIRAFAEGGYDGDFCCEVSGQIWKNSDYDAKTATLICYQNLKAAFERAGVTLV